VFVDNTNCISAKVVSRWLPTAAARVRAQVMWDLRWTKWHWGRFSPSTSVSPASSQLTDCSTFIIIGAGTIGQLVTDVPSGLSLTPPRETKKNCISAANSTPIAKENNVSSERGITERAV
jgi:hypothetical protein